jgi:ABC-type glycerol-3-phosphate transport system substrate-binding protein
VVGMYFDVGPQSLRELHPDFEWGATYLPHDKQHASELGGNAIGVSRDAKDRDAAVQFARFVTNEENMREFVQDALFLPVRRKLLAEPLQYPYRPDEMQIHLEQSKYVPVELARTVTLPVFHRIGRALGEQLDLAFTGAQSADATLDKLSREIRRATLNV